MPKYQYFPDLPPEDYAALKASIAEHGVLEPVIVDEDGEIIEGHHRVKASKELGIAYPRIVRPGLSEEQKVELGISLNTDRRQLTEENREYVAKRLRRTGYTYGAIGRMLGVSQRTVRRDVAPLKGQEALSPQPETIEAADGKQRPAVYAPREPVPEAPAPEDPEADTRREKLAEFIADLPPVETPRGQRVFMALSRHYHYPEIPPAEVVDACVLLSRGHMLGANIESLRNYAEWILAVVALAADRAQRPLQAVRE